MSVVLLILAIIATIMTGMSIEIFISTCMPLILIHLPVIKWKKLSYLLIPIDSIIIAIWIATTQVGTVLSDYMKEMLPDNEDASLMMATLTLWFVICITSWILEKKFRKSVMNHCKERYTIIYMNNATGTGPSQIPMLFDNQTLSSVMDSDQLMQLCASYLFDDKETKKMIKKMKLEGQIQGLIKFYEINCGLQIHTNK